jgi:hypothetical protein
MPMSRPHEMQNGRHHIIERCCCSHLGIGHLPQQRLNGLDILQDAAEFGRCLAVGVAGPGRQRSISVSCGALSK